MCCKEEKEFLLCSSDAQGGLEYYTAGIGEYTAYTRPSLTNCLILKRAFCLFLVSSALLRSQVIYITCSAHWRFLYFHGQRHARLMRNQSVYDKPKRERSLLITLLSPLLFLAPEVHIRETEMLWTDEVIIETVWKSFMTKLLVEWEHAILLVRIQGCNVIILSSRDCYLVDCDAHGQCRLSCYPWRCHFKS